MRIPIVNSIYCADVYIKRDSIIIQSDYKESNRIRAITNKLMKTDYDFFSSNWYTVQGRSGSLSSGRLGKIKLV